VPYPTVIQLDARRREIEEELRLLESLHARQRAAGKAPRVSVRRILSLGRA
jgi:hypothetical protein